MTRHVLFRFHKEYDVCQQNLAQLRRLNPDVEIHGLYGGEDKITRLSRALKTQLASLEATPFDDAHYLWKNGDLVVRKWHQQHGHKIDFTHLHLIEWDLLLMAPLQDVFGRLKAGTNYTTLHSTWQKAKAKNWTWISGIYEAEIAKLKKEIAAQARPVVTSRLSFGVFPGTVLCKSFLDAYAAVRPSSFSNDETRLSFWSQAFGIRLADTGLFKHPGNFVRCNGKPLQMKEIRTAIKAGAQAVHPVTRVLPDKLLAK